MLFNPQHDQAVRASARGAEYAAWNGSSTAPSKRGKPRQLPSRRRSRGATGGHRARGGRLRGGGRRAGRVRTKATALVRDVSGDRTFDDVNYVFRRS